MQFEVSLDEFGQPIRIGDGITTRLQTQKRAMKITKRYMELYNKEGFYIEDILVLDEREIFILSDGEIKIPTMNIHQDFYLKK